ncbi:MAG TPA: hypothetical protein VG867_00060 [Rhizomicrobium sp.]|nr:hypothetical protein [Rhizomicrobium sp.]
MKRAVALGFLLLSAVMPAHADALQSLMWSRWVNIGPGRSIAQVKPAERAALRRCKTWTMLFRPAGSGIEQTFIAGMTMRNNYPKVLVSQIPGETIFVLVLPDGKTHDTLHLSEDGQVLTQVSPPFRPQTYLRCADAAKKS